ncbi:hypothetical protein SDRG_01971 [Saprolegnia diclina VS20]|uniref:Cytidyltransferase-like domain-containing protein n=1 Tax=Saprolegnia diclina (strain VS20) TaxID=1156394 RepID=T0R1R5_SAPDV|nr:hypothetical protein SDRG_01971 [Saprolegnia diclina VS20]EQC40906.1 hypothetical protein SDRG_01971 [Saprolegnia diclina VS20]|eukprot:XP_008605750.1 hypothetical protein SDRG_01971 [Saprolegnia diclina VS20]
MKRHLVLKHESTYSRRPHLLESFEAPLVSDASALSPRTVQRQLAELAGLRQRVSALEELLSSQQVEPTKSLPQLNPLTVQPMLHACQSTTDLPPKMTAIISRTTTAPALFPLFPAETKPEAAPPDSIATSVDPAHHIFADFRAPDTITTKFMTDQDGTMTVVTSHRAQLYATIQAITKRILLKDEQIFRLKKMVDAEFGDVIQVLQELEHELDPVVVEARILHLLQTGSPSKFMMAAPPSFNASEVPYPLAKIAQALAGTAKDQEVVVLVSSGAYNPVHMLHLRAFYVARQHIESNYKFPVVGAIISPCHDTYVRTKNRRKPREMIPKSHRLGMLEAATATSSWIEVDKWEITRRRVLDYLSTLTHVREICEAQFPAYKFRVLYVCGVNTIVKLSHTALRDEGFGCIAVCRPNQTEMLMKHLGAKWSKTAIVVEDMGVLTCELERATSFRVRKSLVQNEACASMVGKHVSDYLVQHRIGDKIAGREPWTSEDRLWRSKDLPYVEYSDLEIQVGRSH